MVYMACSYKDCPNYGIKRELLSDDVPGPDDARRLCICCRPLDVFYSDHVEHIERARPEPSVEDEPPVPPSPTASEGDLLATALVEAVVASADFAEAKIRLAAIANKLPGKKNVKIV